MFDGLPVASDVHTIVFDFDGVFTDNKVWVDQDGRETVRCDRGDGLAFDLVTTLRAQGLLDAEFFILSKESNPVVLARARKLGLQCHYNIGDKLTFVTEYLASRFPEDADALTGLVYIGNDLNDLPLMRRSGYSVAPVDAHSKIKEVADLVLEERGGEGAVRVFIERLLCIDQLTDEELDELISNC